MEQHALWTLVLLAALAGACLARTQQHEEAFIGWQGETYASEEAKGVRRSWIQQLSWRPRAYVWHNMLSEEEAKHIRAQAAPQMKRSTVVGTNGSSVEDSYRTSYGTFLRRLSDPILTRITRRVSDWTMVPMINQEDMQVLRYGVGQKYGAHMDSLIDESPRMATVLLYLTDTEEGGETAFPDNSEWINDEVKQAQGEMSDCAGKHVAFRPKLGDGLLFFSIRPDGTHEPASMHTGCPVIRGQKWTATVWVHSQPFRPRQFVEPKDPPPVDPGLCRDSNAKCKEWMASGECEKNPSFMRATCRSSCKVCTECAEGDWPCWRKNREAGGWLVYNTTEFI